MLDSTTARGLIHPRMPVVCPNNVDRPDDQAVREWMTTPPSRA
jgi:hypothetical protein